MTEEEETSQGKDFGAKQADQVSARHADKRKQTFLLAYAFATCTPWSGLPLERGSQGGGSMGLQCILVM